MQVQLLPGFQTTKVWTPKQDPEDRDLLEKIAPLTRRDCKEPCSTISEMLGVHRHRNPSAAFPHPA